MLTIPELGRDGGLVHAFSTGDVGGSQATAPEHHAERRRLADRLGLDWESVTVIGAVHGDRVAVVERPSGLVHGVDALITDHPGLPLFATFADCYPIILFDPRRRCLGLAHAGWRGTRAGIGKRAVEALEERFGCQPSDLRAGLGPGICGGCYEVGSEVAEVFPPGVVVNEGGRYRLDLAAANRLQLMEAGLAPGRVHVLGICTLETASLPSHRRSADGSRFGALVALKGQRPGAR